MSTEPERYTSADFAAAMLKAAPEFHLSLDQIRQTLGDDPDPNRAALAQYHACFDDPAVVTEAGNLRGSPSGVDSPLTKCRAAVLVTLTEPQKEYILRNTMRRFIPKEVLDRLPFTTQNAYRGSVDAREEFRKQRKASQRTPSAALPALLPPVVPAPEPVNAFAAFVG